MKAKHTVLAALLVLAGAASGDDVAVLEAKLKADILDKVDQANPIDSATGQRKYISFAMISDIHKCKRVEGDDAATDPVQTYWYGSASCLTEAEQSIRLLGSLAVDAGLDAVINGGDMSTAPIMGDGTKLGLTEDEYTNEIWNVKAMFDRHLPAAVPLFTIDGNHERNYSAQGADMHMSDEAWAYVLTNFNTSAEAARERGVGVTYHRDLAAAKLGDNATGRFAGNSYHLDFRRLLASGGPNVRIACVSLYDGATGGESQYRAYDAGQFYDPATQELYDPDLTPENTVMGMVAHGSEEKVSGSSGRGAAGTLQCGFMNGWSNPQSHTGPWNLGTHRGRAFFGLVAAHFHFTNEKTITDANDSAANPDNTVYASAVSVASAYAVNEPSKPKNHELGTEAAYHFSIFVVDTDSNLLREVRVGGWSGTYPNPHEDPVVQLHETNIRTHLDPSVPTPPVLGTVTVTPAVTNATLSGTISSLGSGATACDVYLAVGTSANDLGAAAKIAEGATASFSYVISNLTAETTYYYSLSVSNNAETAMGAAKSGNFTTGAGSVDPGPGILPGETPAETRETIQDAIDAAAILAEPGTVTLAAGLFEIDAQLMVTGGVTLVGQGWSNTVVRQTEAVPTTENGQATRVLTVGAGSTVRGLALTGGRVTGGNNQCGGGVFVDGGTVSWCCITNNSIYGENNKYGGGVGFSHCSGGTIDHSIIADNTVSVSTGVEFGGGGIGGYFPEGSVTIDSCLVAGNRSIHANGHYGKGGGIGVNLVYRDYTVTVRNTTVVGNTAGEDGATIVSEGGGVFTAVDTHGTFAMIDCIVAGNTTTGTNTTVSLSYDGGVDWCLFDVEEDKIGANSLFGAPKFVDAADGDYRLSWDSPAVGNGETYEGIGDDLAGVAFAEIPSMGCYEYGDLAATPAFALPSGSCFHPATNVAVSCGTADAKIFYTTDGSRPTEASTPYTGPIEVSATTTIKARAYAEGVGPSAVATATYTLRRPTPKPTDFAKSVRITLPAALCPNEITTGVPALVRLGGSAIAGFEYGDFALPNGGDMMFVDANGEPLPHEVDTWNEDGESLVWVRLPSTAANTTITLYYGNGAVSPAEPEEVWGDYIGVWHLNEASGDAQDATGHGLAAVPTGLDAAADSVGVACQVGNGRQMATQKGNQSYLAVADDPLLDCGDSLTFSGWFKATGTFANYSMRYVSRKDAYNGSTGWEVEARYSTEVDNSAKQVAARGNAQGEHLANVPDIRENWLHLAVVYRGTEVTFYVNGIEQGPVGMSGATPTDNDLPLAFGNNAAGSEANWVGFMDELRLSADPRSADYAIAEYNAMNMSGPDVFVYGDARDVGGVIRPRETPEETRRTIQDAIDEAAAMSPVGTVTLSEGLFDIDVQLWVTNGVTLVGQGWTNTTVRYTGKKGSDGRVMNVADGSVVGHMAITGGKVDNNNKSGGGALVTEGTITWCCITNNYAIRSDGGGGIFVYRGNDDPAKVRIDHTIVANNAAGTNFLAGVGGGIGIHGRTGLEVEIESCLVYGNVSGKPGSDLASHGAGIAVTGVAANDRVNTVIRNTIVADNVARGAAKGGGIYIDQADTTLVNCLFANNTADSGDGNVMFKNADIAAAVAANTSNCLFGDGTTVFGANPVGLDGSVAFVNAAAGDYHLADTSLVMEKGADYAGIGTDLDGRAYAWPPSIGCYEYGNGVRPPPTWDIPVAGGGGIKGLDDGQGGTTIVFMSIERAGDWVTVGFRAARIDANGATVGLLCKEDLASSETFVLNAVLADDGSGDATLATLTAETDKERLFAVGICTAEE